MTWVLASRVNDVLRRLRWLGLVACLLLVTGCQAEGFLELHVDNDGGGTVYVAVAFDLDAAARTVFFEQKLPVDDLVATGWTVTGPSLEGDGRYWVRAQKAFSQLDQIPGILEEVGGKDGPFRDFAVQRDGSFGRTEWSFTGTVDLSGGLAAFSDAALTATLGGQPLGQPADAYTQEYGAPLESLAKLNVVVDLPGEVQDSNGTVGRSGLAAPTTTATTAAGRSTTTAAASAGLTSTTTTAAAGSSSPGGAAVVWSPSFGGAPQELSATSVSTRLAPRLWRWAGFLLGAIAAVVLLYRMGQVLLDLRRDRRREARRAGRTRGAPAAVPVPLPPFGQGSGGESAESGDTMVPGGVGSHPLRAPGQPVGGASMGPVTPAGAVSTAGALGGGAPSPGSDRGLALIVIETTGALLKDREPVADVLVPFARERGCVLSVRQIADLYLARVVGGMPAGEFWGRLGLTGDPVLLDDVYARRLELSDDVLAFLSRARQRGVTVAAVGDDVPEWTSVLRQRFRLDGLVGLWISSAEVGVRVPHPGLLEAVERATRLQPGNAMVIGASRPLLDVARRNGYRTIHYNPGPDDPESDHPVLRSFADRSKPPQGTPAA